MADDIRSQQKFRHLPKELQGQLPLHSPLRSTGTDGRLDWGGIELYTLMREPPGIVLVFVLLVELFCFFLWIFLFYYFYPGLLHHPEPLTARSTKPKDLCFQASDCKGVYAVSGFLLNKLATDARHFSCKYMRIQINRRMSL